MATDAAPSSFLERLSDVGGAVKQHVGHAITDVVAPTAKKAAASLSDRIDSAAEVAATVKAPVAAAAGRVAAHIPDSVVSIAVSAGGRIESIVDDKITSLRGLREELRQKIVARLVRRLRLVLRFASAAALEKVRDKLRPDDDAPQFVHAWIDEAVNRVAPDAESELNEMLLSLALDEAPDSSPYNYDAGVHIGPNDEHSCGCSTLWWTPIAFLRYRMAPYNRSIWWQLRSPTFWLFTLVSLIPRYAIGQILYLAWFFIGVDKSDEYQLLKYILDFKGLMFVNGGVVSALVGLGQLYVCSVNSSCTAHAPMEEYFTLFIFVLQVGFVWAALVLMQCGCAERKGGFAYQYATAAAQQRAAAMHSKGLATTLIDSAALFGDDDTAAGDCDEGVSDRSSVVRIAVSEHPTATHNSAVSPPSAGGAARSIWSDAVSQVRFENEVSVGAATRHRLIGFLVYDVVIFFLCVGAIAWSAFYNLLDRSAEVDFSRYPETLDARNWKFLLTIYVVRCFYGIASFPFALFHLPGFQLLLTHSRPTAFDEKGSTVAVRLPEVRSKRDDQTHLHHVD